MSIFKTFVWNIDINFIVFKKQIKNIFWNIGINFVVNKNWHKWLFREMCPKMTYILMYLTLFECERVIIK